MSSSMNYPGNQPNGMPQAVVEDIDEYLVDGLPVFDENIQQVGDVKMYSTAAGYLMVGSGPFEQVDLYIPFRLIRSIDANHIYLSASKAALKAQYTQPPQTQRVVETRLVAGPGGTMSPQTREVQVLQSGYDSRLIELNPVDVGSVANRLAVGMVVYDAKGKRLGDITQYDTARDLMVVEKGVLNPRAVLVPFSAIQDINIDTFTVDLTIAEDTLLKEHALLPDDGS